MPNTRDCDGLMTELQTTIQRRVKVLHRKNELYAAVRQLRIYKLSFFNQTSYNPANGASEMAQYERIALTSLVEQALCMFPLLYRDLLVISADIRMEREDIERRLVACQP